MALHKQYTPPNLSQMVGTSQVGSGRYLISGEGRRVLFRVLLEVGIVVLASRFGAVNVP